IGFYYERHTASNAANKAFITNRVGDAGFILGLLIVFAYMGTFDFEELFRRVRSPVTDGEQEVMPLAGRVVRGELIERKLTEKDKTRTVHHFEMSPDDGSQVLL